MLLFLMFFSFLARFARLRELILIRLCKLKITKARLSLTEPGFVVDR